MSERARICVIGSITMDLVARAPRLPRPGETVLGTSFAVFPGGKGANQAVAAARMGAEVSLVGAVGDDAYGREVLALLGCEAMDVSGVAVRPGTHTGTSLIGLGEDGENSIIAVPGANMTVSPDDIDAARTAIAAADVLLLQLEIPMASVARAVAVAQEVGTTVILNAAPAAAIPAEVLTGVDVLVVNRLEGEAIGQGRTASRIEAAADARDPEAVEILSKLAGLGAGSAVLTLGVHGSACVLERSCSFVEAFAVEAVDTVGAGDAYCGALAVRWAEDQIGAGRGVEGKLDALHWASAAGALAVTRPGALPSMPTRGEVRRLLARL